MPSDAGPTGEAIHATAVAIGDGALLIIGPSRSGKSRLAAALIDATTRRTPIRLIGDDRVLLTHAGNYLLARGHPRTQGFIERRGLGIVTSPFIECADVRAIVQLGSTTSCPAVIQNFPCLFIVTSDDIRARRDDVLEWWRVASTTHGAKQSSTA